MNHCVIYIYPPPYVKNFAKIVLSLINNAMENIFLLESKGRWSITRAGRGGIWTNLTCIGPLINGLG